MPVVRQRTLRVCSILVPIALLELSCERGRSGEPHPEARANVRPAVPVTLASARRPDPGRLAGMPGPIVPEHGHAQEPPRPAVSVKSAGTMGELVEGDVYEFKLLSLKDCGRDPEAEAARARQADGQRARVPLGAEVEITAKAKLNLSPRDVSIGTGGVVFNGSIDQNRKLEGCEPRLPLKTLRANETVRGFVVFDVPLVGPGSDVTEMTLSYQPTRFGGAGQVRVAHLARGPEPDRGKKP